VVRLLCTRSRCHIGEVGQISRLIPLGIAETEQADAEPPQERLSRGRIAAPFRRDRAPPDGGTRGTTLSGGHKSRDIPRVVLPRRIEGDWVPANAVRGRVNRPDYTRRYED